MPVLARFDRLQFLNLNAVRSSSTRAVRLPKVAMLALSLTCLYLYEQFMSGVNLLLQQSDQLKHLAMKSAGLNADCIHILAVAVAKVHLHFTLTRADKS